MANISLEQTDVTLEDIMKLGEDARIEVINGVVVEMAPVGGLHHIVAGNIYRTVDAYVLEHNLGTIFMDGLLFLMHEKDRHLRGSFAPDISFIRNENFPHDWNLLLPFPGVPDFAVEVISPSENAEDVQTKIRTYLDKGTQEVWVAYPLTRELYQYRAESNTIRVYSIGEQIDTERLFPGLVLTVDDVFKLPHWATHLNAD